MRQCHRCDRHARVHALLNHRRRLELGTVPAPTSPAHQIHPVSVHLSAPLRRGARPVGPPVDADDTRRGRRPCRGEASRRHVAGLPELLTPDPSPSPRRPGTPPPDPGPPPSRRPSRPRPRPGTPSRAVPVPTCCGRCRWIAAPGSPEAVLHATSGKWGEGGPQGTARGGGVPQAQVQNSAGVERELAISSVCSRPVTRAGARRGVVGAGPGHEERGQDREHRDGQDGQEHG